LITSRLLFVYILLILCIVKSSGQEYSYRHYDINDGLVGNQVYHAVLDRENFLWFCTETGVSRFDGTHFKNFTTADGLPDNEILKMFVDSRGRVWMMPFKNDICYYSKGKIHNTKNDTVLSRLALTANISSISENAGGDIVLLDNTGIIILRSNGKISRFGGLNNQSPPLYTFIGAGAGPQGDFFLYLGDNINPAAANRFLFRLKILPDTFLIQREPGMAAFEGGTTNDVYISNNFLINPGYTNDNKVKQLDIYNNRFKETIKMPVANGLNWISLLTDTVIYFNTTTGVSEYNCRKKAFTTRYLEGQNISNTLKDSEGNLWFTTPGNGVWRLYSRDINTIALSDSIWPKQVFSISGHNNKIIAGSNGERVYLFDIATGKNGNYFTLRNSLIKKCLKIIPYGKYVYYLTEDGIFSTNLSFGDIQDVTSNLTVSMTCKDMDLFPGTGEAVNIILATHSIVMLIKKAGVKTQVSRIYAGRSTSVCRAGSRVYIGTLAGLKYSDSAGNITELATLHPLLANRITKLLYAKNKLWIGTNDNGLVCFDGEKVVKNISVKEGLTGNIIRALYAGGDYLWVGTDRGLNKISIADTACPVVMRYTAADGLSSDMIHAVYVNNGNVYAGTPGGITFFDETKISNSTRCDLRILGITVSGVVYQYDSSALLLSHKNNNIRFDFVGISYKSAGDIVYSYKLSGIDDDWKTTRENFLQYPTLPSGSYELLLQAVNKFGVKSEIAAVKFEIAKTIAEENWFRLVVLAAALGLTWWLASLRTKRIRRRDREKMETSARIAELEQQALKAQMNPHFIFNCLNSIQHYVMDKDVAGANKFITGFSRLIRQTLENSSKQLISVEEEEAFLNTYLALEKNRFEDKFDYRICIDEKIQKDEFFLPPMLLQPFIENSIRHGIRLKQNGRGLIEINISLSINHIICTIIDNGAGRDAALASRSNQHIEYQSRGMQLTGQRIELLNKDTGQDISLNVEDLVADNGAAAGTKVTISFPLQNTGRKQ
jgi:ligand-binding sensor domain-containing protein